jgi:uncharacterized protein YggU (UPF0235/DUF167 family)
MYIKVHVSAGAKHESIIQTGPNRFTLQVREPAERNLANRRIIELVAIQMERKPAQVRIVNGHQSSTKLLSVVD